MGSKPSSENMFAIDSLGTPSVASPIELPKRRDYVTDDQRTVVDPTLSSLEKAFRDAHPPSSFEIAGPRPKLFFHPERTKAAIVTCGGLCPGINAVIRGLVMQLWYRYGVRSIHGVRFGYQGLAKTATEPLMPLMPDSVDAIHHEGGSLIGSSRGTPPTEEKVAMLREHGINVLFAIGGDGTMRGALALSEEAKRQGLSIAIVGIPKTIDNDIPFVKKSFGFESAVAIATESIASAHAEARGVRNGIGLVKLMGRHSGYIAASAALAAGQVNFCLIPEQPFALEGENGLLALLEQRLKRRGHAVIVVAEGAGQYFFKGAPERKDSSGNVRLGDIGTFLADRITMHFQGQGMLAPVRYIDPSYLIRSARANPADTLFCFQLAQNAVHSAMAGKTGLLMGYWHGQMTHVPLKALGAGRQTVNPNGELWFNVVQLTGQPQVIGEGT